MSTRRVQARQAAVAAHKEFIMRAPTATALLATLALASAAPAANVYILSSGDAATDNAVIAALTSRGHTCTLGPQYFNFTGQGLAGYDTVYLQANTNWWAGWLSTSAAQALMTWVNAGGRLVTSEWVTYYSATVDDAFYSLRANLPLVHTTNYGSASSTTYDRVLLNGPINAGLPDSFTFPLVDYAGTEIYTVARPTANTWYASRGAPGAAGLAGWLRGYGFVYSFSTTCGPAQLADPNFGRLFSNVMGFVCYPNCDNSSAAPVLNVGDFGCFLNRFAAGDTRANCDGSTAVPVLTVQDFACFLNAFAAGCP
jgi:hypothetical protein